MTRSFALGLSALFGCFLATSFLPWVSTWGGSAFLLSVGVAGLIRVLSQVSGAALAAQCGALFGVVWLLGGTGWMYVSLHQFGGLPAWMAALAVLCLCLALSGFMAAAAALWVQWRRGTDWLDGLLWASLWFLAEWARGFVFTGFPWASSGYALLDSMLASLIPWVGVYGLGAVAVWLISWMVLRLSLWPLALGLGLLSWVPASVFPAISFSQSIGESLKVTLLQGNIPQDEKFASHHLAEQLIWHTQQLRWAQGDLVVAPETAIPLLPMQLPAGYWDQLTRSFAEGQRSALIGVPLGDFDQGYTNSVAGLSASALAQPGGFYRYNKHHLVPFGEFIPLGFHWFVRMMNIPLGDFTRGPSNAPSFQVKSQWVAPTICYEDLFGEELASRFVSGAHPAPTIFANVSNLAWFGESVAIHQHLQIARMRSMEFQRPTIRATNTGATVVIDHQGQVIASLATNTRGALVATVQGRAGNTPYAHWVGRFGLWPLVFTAFFLVGVTRRRGL